LWIGWRNLAKWAHAQQWVCIWRQVDALGGVTGALLQVRVLGC